MILDGIEKAENTMTEIKHSPHRHEDPNRHRVQHGHGPYWKRAHRDWRFWVGLFMMLAAISTYVMSDDLSGWPRSQAQQPLSGPVAK
jgi:hypothetical protein